MARLFQGRMRYPSYVGGRRHPRAGRPHPFLYAGARNRRTFAHKYFGTQPTGYGLRGGDPRTSGVSGAAGRVYRHMLGGAMRPQRGTGYRTSHQLGHYRSGLSKAGKDAYANFMGGRTRHDFGSGREFRAARSQARRERSQARRGYARDYKNPYTGTGHRRFTKVSHRDPGTGIRRNYFGGFTGNLSQGSRNLIDRRHKQLQGVSQRKFKKVDWGRAHDRDDARRRRLNKEKGWNMPLRDYVPGGTSFVAGSNNRTLSPYRDKPLPWADKKRDSAPTLLEKDGVWHWRKPSGGYTPLRNQNFRSQAWKRPAPSGGRGGGRGGMFSDRRLKTDITLLGHSPSGIAIYQFRYKSGGPFYRGVIAQEVIKSNPEAVIKDESGYYAVQYDKIDVDFLEVPEDSYSYA